MKKDRDEKGTQSRRRMTRRRFITTVGTGAVGVAASGSILKEGVQASESEEVKRASVTTKITLSINGRDHRVLVEPRWSLLFVLRERLGLTGTKVGCERGECGACTVLIDGVARYACITLALEAVGHKITTIEGVMDGEDLGPVQRAFVEEDAYQCGYCTPGQIMAAEGLLRSNPNPSGEEILRGMSGNYCRCASYKNIAQAVKHASMKKPG
jgi:xanthine dehydrogenase YagT iron-sulfur-binding subunit